MNMNGNTSVSGSHGGGYGSFSTFVHPGSVPDSERQTSKSSYSSDGDVGSRPIHEVTSYKVTNASAKFFSLSYWGIKK